MLAGVASHGHCPRLEQFNNKRKKANNWIVGQALTAYEVFWGQSISVWPSLGLSLTFIYPKEAKEKWSSKKNAGQLSLIHPNGKAAL